MTPGNAPSRRAIPTNRDTTPRTTVQRAQKPASQTLEAPPAGGKPRRALTGREKLLRSVTDSWTVNMPTPVDWINLNDRQHWRTKARLTKAWRNAAHVYARQAKLPKGLARLQIDVFVFKPTDARYDPGNLMPTVKAVVDGLMDYGLAEDDNRKILAGPFIHHGGKGTPGITVKISELVG